MTNNTDSNQINILLTGAAGSLGKAIVEYFYQKSCKILALDIDEPGLASLKSDFPLIEVFACDLTNYQSVEAVMTKALANNSIDILINNAGTIHSEPLINLLGPENNHHKFSSWQKTLDTNLTSTFNVTCFVAEQMVKQRNKGLIVNMSSISANGNIGQSAYSAAKSGVNALTITWSKELSLFGIRTVAIAPGYIKTDSTHLALSKHQIEKITDSIPIKKLGQVEDIISTIQFAIDNQYLNGTIIEVDGGLRI